MCMECWRCALGVADSRSWEARVESIWKLLLRSFIILDLSIAGVVLDVAMEQRVRRIVAEESNCIIVTVLLCDDVMVGGFGLTLGMDTIRGGRRQQALPKRLKLR